MELIYVGSNSNSSEVEGVEMGMDKDKGIVEAEDKPGEEVEEDLRTDMHMGEKAGGVYLRMGTLMDMEMDKMGQTKLDHHRAMGLCDKHHLIKYLSRSRPI